MLEAVHKLAVEALTATAHLLEDGQAIELATRSVEPTGKKRKDEQTVPLTTIQPFSRNDFFLEDSPGSRAK
jgi:aspartokinase-like uncharacterized kinase